MDLYFRRYDDYLTLYNCSFYNSSLWPRNDRKSHLLGALYVAIFIMGVSLYIPIIRVLRHDQLKGLFCYRIMLLLAIYDVLLLPVTALGTGLFSYYGIVFCDAPTMMYIMGTWLTSLWYGHSAFSIILAFNRCVCFTRLQSLFDGCYQYIWFCLPLLYTLSEFAFCIPAIFSPTYYTWFFNPHIGFYDDLQGRYPNINQTINNLLVAGLIPSFYLFFYIYIQNLVKTRFENTKSERILFYQVFALSMLHSFGCLGYVLMQILPIPGWLITYSQINWLICQVAPPIIYLTRNKTFQRRLFNMKSGQHGYSSSNYAKDNRVNSTVNSNKSVIK